MSHKKHHHPEDISEFDYDYLGKSASATDCTGLIPFGPVSKEELTSYQDVYPFEPKAVSLPDEEKGKKI